MIILVGSMAAQVHEQMGVVSGVRTANESEVTSK